MDEHQPPMRRRDVLGLLAGAALFTPGAHAANPAPLALEDPQQQMLAYLRMRTRLDGAQTFMPYRGTIFGKPEGATAVPLFDVEGFSWERATRLDATTYRLDSAEAGYFLDRTTGQPLGHWTNPLNGLETEVKHYRSGAHLLVRPGSIEPITSGPPPEGTSFSASMGLPTVMNGHVWMHEDLIGRFPSPPRVKFPDPLQYFGPVLTASSLATWCSRLADLADPARDFVPTTLAYQTLGSWRPFMRMGSAPGLISWRMFGAKAQSVDAVPPALRERVLREYPDFLAKETMARGS
jgi:hypothetical protein